MLLWGGKKDLSRSEVCVVIILDQNGFLLLLPGEAALDTRGPHFWWILTSQAVLRRFPRNDLRPQKLAILFEGEAKTIDKGVTFGHSPFPFICAEGGPT